MTLLQDYWGPYRFCFDNMMVVIWITSFLHLVVHWRHVYVRVFFIFFICLSNTMVLPRQFHGAKQNTMVSSSYTITVLCWPTYEGGPSVKALALFLFQELIWLIWENDKLSHTKGEKLPAWDERFLLLPLWQDWNMVCTG